MDIENTTGERQCLGTVDILQSAPFIHLFHFGGSVGLFVK